LSFDAAIISTAYYLFFPYAILASRSFQPDPLMVMLIVAFWWTFSRWMDITSGPSPERRGERWGLAILAGILGGLAIFIKFSAAFFVIGAALGLGLSRLTVRQMLRNGQIWAMALLGMLPGMVYLVNGLFVQGGLGSQFSGRFVPALLINPFNYLAWMVKVDLAAGGFFVMLALLGFFLTDDRRFRSLMFGLWGAYLLYSLFFNYHSATHDYYQLPFIPIVAISLAPLGSWFFARLAETTVRRYQRSMVYLILIAGLFMVVWNTRNLMKVADYRSQAAMWAEMGQLLKGKSVVALVGDYGAPMEYWGWKTGPIWPYTGDTRYARGGVLPTQELFDEYSSKRDLFLVTDFDELERQPALKELLARYPVLVSGNGFVIYDLEALR
jgi:4-amino-4-deoxy-L-arabinose transferase-like glycosyltransferase